MATDKTEPPIKTILTVAAVSIATLVGLRFAFVSYFNSMYEAEEHRVVLDVNSPILSRMRDESEQRLSQGRPTPITQAIQQFAGSARPGAVEPRPSTDIAPLQGWMQSPREVPVAPAPTQPVQAAQLPGSPQVVAPSVDVTAAPSAAPAAAPSAAPAAPLAAPSAAPMGAH